ncbi:MAG: leucyl/phenylalanyl-tRNA--protein transferase [Propionibacteriaceae bacterium]|jgi:leucyl/phenylalanyl-tRNA--protein transferase|nr:leucyl/phenylalanyl-tRNA--protein transferase [Propionibacteriaceae bacterium]
MFGDPSTWPADDLIAYSTGFAAPMAWAGYHEGVFPMPLDRRMGWWSPLRRGVLRLDGLRVSRSLRQSAKRYRTTCDQAFGRVLAACADPERPYGWIDGRIREVYTTLRQAGVAHSVECWNDDGELVGGLYGVAVGGLFAGESMFHDARLGRDASKVALLALVSMLRDEHAPNRLIDVQWLTPHLASLGAEEIPRDDYLHRLPALRSVPPPPFQTGPLSALTV